MAAQFLILLLAVVDSTQAVQDAINKCPEGGSVRFPAAEYWVRGVVIPANKTLHLIGSGAAIKAMPGAESIIRIAGDVRRKAPLRISGLEIDGNNTGCAGISTDDKDPRTNLHISDVSIVRCGVGLDLSMAMLCHVQDCVISRCDIGLRVRQKSNAGGGNANLFSNVEIYANKIGCVLDGRGSRWPMAGNLFAGGAIQSNSIAGAVCIESLRNTFYGMHFEANATGQNTYELDGITIEPCNVRLVRSSLITSDVGWGSARNNIISDGESTATLEGYNAYSNTAGNFMTDGLLTIGGNLICGGQITATTFGHWTLEKPVLRFAFKENANLRQSKLHPSLVVKPPSFRSPIDCRITEEECDIFGKVSQVQFSSGAGSTQKNRVILDPSIGKLKRGDAFIVALTVKSDQKASVRFDLTSGSFAFWEGTISDDWQTIVMCGIANNSGQPMVYAYPRDASGAKLQIGHLYSFVGLMDSVRQLVSGKTQ